jgi:hypothetical protein
VRTTGRYNKTRLTKRKKKESKGCLVLSSPSSILSSFQDSQRMFFLTQFANLISLELFSNKNKNSLNLTNKEGAKGTTEGNHNQNQIRSSSCFVSENSQSVDSVFAARVTSGIMSVEEDEEAGF